MTGRTEFQIRILEKLGVPLIGAVCATAGSAGEGGRSEAEQVAELLGKAVQTALALFESANMKDTDMEGDAARLAMTAVAASLVGAQYRTGGKPPAEPEIRKIVKAMQAVLSFSDNFAATDKTLERITGLSPSWDGTQESLCTAMAMVPVVNAIAGFPFGRPEQKLAQEVAARLESRAGVLAQALAAGGDVVAARRRLLPVLAQVYAACHEQQKTRLAGMSAAEREKLTAENGGAAVLDDLWRAFDQRILILSELAGAMTGAKAPAERAAPQAVTAMSAAPAGDAKFNPMTFFGARSGKADEEGKAA